MKDLRNQFDGVRGFDALSGGFHTFNFSPSYKTALHTSCGIAAFFVRPSRSGGLQSAVGALTNFRTFAGKATLPEPWEGAGHVCYAFKPKSLNCLSANVRDGFFDRIRRENQV